VMDDDIIAGAVTSDKRLVCFNCLEHGCNIRRLISESWLWSWRYRTRVKLGSKADPFRCTECDQPLGGDNDIVH
jgi:hypothetical protein